MNEGANGERSVVLHQNNVYTKSQQDNYIRIIYSATINLSFLAPNKWIEDTQLLLLLARPVGNLK